MNSLNGGGRSQSANKNIETIMAQTLKTKDYRLMNSFKKFDANYPIPPKIIKIEEKLQKFKDEALRHELLAKSLKEKEMKEDYEAKMIIRDYEMEKTRKNKEYVLNKKFENIKNWKKTQNDKIERKAKEKKLEDFFTQKIKNKVYNEKKDTENQFKEGVQYFENNCQKLGIDLNHEFDTKPGNLIKIDFHLKKNF